MPFSSQKSNRWKTESLFIAEKLSRFILSKAIADKLSGLTAKKFRFKIWHFVQESPLELISGVVP